MSEIIAKTKKRKRNKEADRAYYKKYYTANRERELKRGAEYRKKQRRKCNNKIEKFGYDGLPGLKRLFHIKIIPKNKRKCTDCLKYVPLRDFEFYKKDSSICYNCLRYCNYCNSLFPCNNAIKLYCDPCISIREREQKELINKDYFIKWQSENKIPPSSYYELHNHGRTCLLCKSKYNFLGNYMANFNYSWACSICRECFDGIEHNNKYNIPGHVHIYYLVRNYRYTTYEEHYEGIISEKNDDEYLNNDECLYISNTYGRAYLELLREDVNIKGVNREEALKISVDEIKPPQPKIKPKIKYIIQYKPKTHKKR